MRIKAFVAVVGITMMLVLAAACSNGEASTGPDTGPQPSTPAQGAAGAQAPQPGAAEPSTRPQQPVTSPGLPVGAPVAPVARPVEKPAPEPRVPEVVVPTLGAPASAPARAAVSPSFGGVSASYGLPLFQASTQQSGIWVTGQATVSMEPDLATLNIGVETEAATVAAARDEAATAMAAIVAAVKAYGLSDRDIQTRYFNINPMYEFQEVTQLGRRTSQRVLVGYRVNNSASIHIRDLDQVGTIIDDVANAGGNATRINGVSFTVEDPQPFMAKLREAAVQDAIAKAGQFADLTGSVLGRLVFISEVGASAPVVTEVFAARAFAEAAPAAPTSISGGELDLRLSVQAVFEIQ